MALSKAVVDSRNFEEKSKEAPLTALTFPSRSTLSHFLNPEQKVPVRGGPAHGVCADWRGIAELAGLDLSTIRELEGKHDSTSGVLHAWLNGSTHEEPTVANLWKFIKQLHRQDLIKEISWYLEQDVRKYQRHKDSGQLEQLQDIESSQSDGWSDHHVNEFEMMCLNDEPGNPAKFDAFVCHATEDTQFVKEMINKLEGPPHNIRLCVPNRDMVAGASTYTIVSKIMAERCTRIIIVVSPEFYDSDMCDYQIKFAFTLNPGVRKMKMLGVIYKEVTNSPTVLQPYTKLDYTKKELRVWFWKRLADAISNKQVNTTPEDKDDHDFVIVGSADVQTDTGSESKQSAPQPAAVTSSTSVTVTSLLPSFLIPISVLPSASSNITYQNECFEAQADEEFVFLDVTEQDVDIGQELPVFSQLKISKYEKNRRNSSEKVREKRKRSNSFELQLMSSGEQ